MAKSHKTVSINHIFLKRKESRSGSNLGPFSYQPSALPLGHTGWPLLHTARLGVVCHTWWQCLLPSLAATRQRRARAHINMAVFMVPGSVIVSPKPRCFRQVWKIKKSAWICQQKALRWLWRLTSVKSTHPIVTVHVMVNITTSLSLSLHIAVITRTSLYFCSYDVTKPLEAVTKGHIRMWWYDICNNAS